MGIGKGDSKLTDLTRAEQLFKEREARDNSIKAQEEARVEAMRAKIQRLRALRVARDNEKTANCRRSGWLASLSAIERGVYCSSAPRLPAWRSEGD